MRRSTLGVEPSALRDRTLLLPLDTTHRASLPGGAGGKQVAIVQPQRRHASDNTDVSSARSSPQTTLVASTSRRNTSLQELNTSSTDAEDKSKRKPTTRTSPKGFLNTTKATLWIESRKGSPRRKVQSSPQVPPAGRRSLPHKKSTPLRLTVLKRVQSARKARVVKIEAPLKIDHTKQAAIMLMTGHTPKSRITISPKNKGSSKKSPLYVVKKSSAVRKTPVRKSRQSGRGGGIVVTPSRGSTFAQDSANRRSSKRSSGTQSVSVLEITDSTQNSTVRASNASTRSGKTPHKSPSLPSPKKSAMKDHSKKSVRKTESIKFDLSNLESHQDSNDVMSLTDTTSGHSEDITLHYSDSSSHSSSPSPRRSIHSRSSKMLERAGTSLGSPSRTPTSTPTSPSRTLTPESPSARRSIRGSAMVKLALDTSAASDRTITILSPTSLDSDRTRTIPSADSTVLSDKTKTVLGANSTRGSAFRTRTLSPRNNLESYSVVDLVSFDSDDATKSVYNSAESADSSQFGTPQTTGRRTRSTIGPNLLGTSTPYESRGRPSRTKSSSNASGPRTSAVSTRRSKSLTTPENKHVSVNSTRVSRASRSRSRINDSDLLLDDTEDASPKTSRRSRANKSATNDDLTAKDTDKGLSTPENRRSPEAVGTPVLSIQSLLDSSRSSIGSRTSARKFTNYKKSIGVTSESRASPHVTSVRKTRLRLSNDSDRTDEGAPRPDNEDTVTPRSAVKLFPEPVKNKHSTAKKPLSKRSIIDDLNSSDIVKVLFKSPVKRKLSKSMTEMSRRQLFDDDDEVVQAGRTPDVSLSEPLPITSPVETPTNSPNRSGSRRSLKPVRNTLQGGGDSPHVIRKRASLRTVKVVPTKSPKNDLRRVTGVHHLFKRKSPKNDLTDVRGVKRMFQRNSAHNDLRNVSGVKRTFRKSPENDLTDVRGVRKMFKSVKPATSLHDLSGVEELFDSSTRSDRSEELFDMLVGRPPIKAVYSKTFTSNAVRKPRSRRRSLRKSIEVTPDNVSEWLEQELKQRLQSNASKSVTKELQKLATDTVAGFEPIQTSRTRNSSFKSERSGTYIYDASTLPIKKRSLVSSAERSRPHLPLKKRAVNSTPIKDRVNVTMCPVSPIADSLDARDIERDCYVSRSTQTIEEHKETALVSKTRTPRKQETPKKIVISKSPEKSPEKCLPKRATRNRKITETSLATTKKRRGSLVVGKKVPALVPKSPKPDPKDSSARPSRQTRNTKVALVVPKPSPKMKPQSPKAIPKTTRARRLIQTPSPKPSSQSKKTRAVNKNEPKPKDIVEKPVKRGRRNVTPEIEEPQQKRIRKTKASSNIAETTKKAVTVVKTRGKAAKSPTVEKQPNIRGKRAQIQTEPATETNITSTRGRRGQNSAKIQPQPERTVSNTRGKKAQTVVAVPEKKQPNPRGKKVQFEAEPAVEEKPTTTRGRSKPTSEQSKNLSPRGKKAQLNKISEAVENKSNTRARRGQTDIAVAPQPSTRRGQKAQPVENVPKTRGKKVQSPAKVPEPTTRGRKRKAPAAEETPTKKSKPEPKNASSASNKPTNTRITKKVNVAKEEVTTRSKRKAPEPLTKASKKPAQAPPSGKYAAPSPAPSPAPRSRRAARDNNLILGPEKTVRGRRR